ncbi:MAG: ABC transporter permease [Theionarchaea archaeon]|nr:ABC transporter permease [Theionarchaea archaeon]
MRALSVAKKDWRELPGYFKISTIIVPAMMIFVIGTFIFTAGTSDAIEDLPNLPDSLFPPGSTDLDRSLYFAVNIMAPPFFLMLATMLPITIAADAFAGERERKTLEALLVVPMSSRDLFLGKSLLPLAYGFGASLVAFLVTTIMVNVGFPDATISMPNLTWLILIFLSVPAFSMLGILVQLLISTRVDRTYFAVQIGSLIILPILVFFIGGITGILLMGPTLLLAVTGGIVLLDYILFQIGSDSLARGL